MSHAPSADEPSADEPSAESVAAPPAGTIEAWCFRLVTGAELAAKLAPGAPPDARDARSWEPAPRARRIRAPGRPPELVLRARAARTPRSLREPRARAQLLHAFLHHELQAAELFAWAVLAFPTEPRAFRS